MSENRVRRAIDGGGLAFGTYAGVFADPAIVELIGLAGFDAVFIDMEHMAFDLSDVRTMILAAERVGITPIVRTPGLDRAATLRLLDMGAQGIYVPHVNSAAEARAAVDAVRYPPLGGRGMGATSRAARYGTRPLAEHMAAADHDVVLAVIIEDVGGVDAIDAIVELDGIDLIAIGPSDLCRSLGVAGQSDHPELRAAIDRILAAVARAGKARLAIPVGHPMYPRTVAELRAMGVVYANCGPAPEVRLLDSLARQRRSLDAARTTLSTL